MKIIILFTICGIIFICGCMKRRHAVREAFAGFLTGGISLLAVSAINPLIPINVFTLSASMLSGPAFAAFLLYSFS